jgi:hypothetical protein
MRTALLSPLRRRNMIARTSNAHRCHDAAAIHTSGRCPRASPTAGRLLSPACGTLDCLQARARKGRRAGAHQRTGRSRNSSAASRRSPRRPTQNGSSKAQLPRPRRARDDRRLSDLSSPTSRAPRQRRERSPPWMDDFLRRPWHQSAWSVPGTPALSWRIHTGWSLSCGVRARGIGARRSRWWEPLRDGWTSVGGLPVAGEAFTGRRHVLDASAPRPG